MDPIQFIDDAIIFLQWVLQCLGFLRYILSRTVGAENSADDSIAQVGADNRQEEPAEVLVCCTYIKHMFEHFFSF